MSKPTSSALFQIIFVVIVVILIVAFYYVGSSPSNIGYWRWSVLSNNTSTNNVTHYYSRYMLVVTTPTNNGLLSQVKVPYALYLPNFNMPAVYENTSATTPTVINMSYLPAPMNFTLVIGGGIYNKTVIYLYNYQTTEPQPYVYLHPTIHILMYKTLNFTVSKQNYTSIAATIYELNRTANYSIKIPESFNTSTVNNECSQQLPIFNSCEIQNSGDYISNLTGCNIQLYEINKTTGQKTTLTNQTLKNAIENITKINCHI